MGVKYKRPCEIGDIVEEWQKPPSMFAPAAKDSLLARYMILDEGKIYYDRALKHSVRQVITSFDFTAWVLWADPRRYWVKTNQKVKIRLSRAAFDEEFAKTSGTGCYYLCTARMEVVSK